MSRGSNFRRSACQITLSGRENSAVSLTATTSSSQSLTRLGVKRQVMSSSLKYFTRRAAIDATTTSPYTTNLNHLLTVPKAWRVRRSIYDPKLKSVRTPDRIRFWNVVPGDQIRIRGDKTNTLHEVLSINRLSNRVFVKGAVNVRSRSPFRVNAKAEERSS